MTGRVEGWDMTGRSRRYLVGLMAMAIVSLPAIVAPAGAAAVTTVHINEIESNGGTPGDWVELVNVGADPVDLTGWKVLDNDNGHTPSVLPAGSTIAPGGYLIVEEAALGFGLGTADSVRLFDPAGGPYETYSWTAHAATTYGRCPDGTGPFVTTAGSTKGAANNCGSGVKINEVESNGGTPGDWVELVNPSASTADISGLIFRDNDDSHGYTIPPGTTLPAGGYFVLEEATFGFGLGGADSARLFDGATVVDAYSWTAHATTTYGRCPNATGSFTTTTSSTKGAANACPGELTFLPWPGGADVAVVDGSNVFGGNLSGLDYEGSGSTAPGVLWGVRNGPGSLFRLVYSGGIWTPDPSAGWANGKALHYGDGTGDPDAEGVTFAGAGSSGGLYVSTERNNAANGVSRNSVLRFDPSSAGTSLNAAQEWNLTADLPVTLPNLGIEAITWVPDSFLVGAGFVDQSKGAAYSPGAYPGHGSGLFFVGLETNGVIYAYALDQAGGAFTRIATISSGLGAVMDLQFDGDEAKLWAVCDDTCNGRSTALMIDASTGTFKVAAAYERPGTMPNINNEGFAITPQSECVANRKPVYWADDSETGGHAIRLGTLACTSPVATALIVQAPSASQTYGTAPPALSPTYVGLTGADTAPATPATCSTPATAASLAGTYPVVCAGAADTKYAITYAPGTLTVTKAPLTVSATSASRAFGQPNPALDVTYSGFVLGQALADSGVSGSPSCTTTAGPTSPAGTYPITCSAGTLASANYSFVFVPGTLTVGKAPSTLVATPVSILGSLLAQKVTMSAMLTSAATGLPSAGQTVTFRLGRSSCSATTDARGVAGCPVPFLEVLSLLQGQRYTASYGGSSDYLPALVTGDTTFF